MDLHISKYLLALYNVWCIEAPHTRLITKPSSLDMVCIPIVFTEHLTDHPGLQAGVPTCEGLFRLSLGPRSTDHIPGPVKAILIAPGPARQGRGSKTHRRDNQDQADVMRATGTEAVTHIEKLSFRLSEGSMMLCEQWSHYVLIGIIDEESCIDYVSSWRFWMFCWTFHILPSPLCVFPAL